MQQVYSIRARELGPSKAYAVYNYFFILKNVVHVSFITQEKDGTKVQKS